MIEHLQEDEITLVQGGKTEGNEKASAANLRSGSKKTLKTGDRLKNSSGKTSKEKPGKKKAA